MQVANRRGSLILALLLTVLFLTNAWPQAGTGTVNGSIRDQTGAVIPGASVTLKNTATNVTLKTTTNDAGMYMFPGIIAGKSIEDEELAMMAIQKIEAESHTTGLTDRIAQLLKEEKSKREEKKNE